MNAFESRLDENILILGRGWMDRTRLTAEEDMIIPRLARLATNQRRDLWRPAHVIVEDLAESSQTQFGSI